jgi:hypothetical protein
VTEEVSSAVSKEMLTLAKLAASSEEKKADAMISKMEAKNAAGRTQVTTTFHAHRCFCINL